MQPPGFSAPAIPASARRFATAGFIVACAVMSNIPADQAALVQTLDMQDCR